MRQSVTDRDDDVRAIQEATEEREETERPSERRTARGLICRRKRLSRMELCICKDHLEWTGIVPTTPSIAFSSDYALHCHLHLIITIRARLNGTLGGCADGSRTHLCRNDLGDCRRKGGTCPECGGGQSFFMRELLSPESVQYRIGSLIASNSMLQTCSTSFIFHLCEWL